MYLTDFSSILMLELAYEYWSSDLKIKAYLFNSLRNSKFELQSIMQM